MEIDQSFAREVQERSGQNLQLCYQCLKCSVGCPTARYMDYTPNRLIRLVQYGRKERVLKSHALWLCVSCWTCGTRCPNEIDMGIIMDTLRQMAIEGGFVADRNVVLLHQEFVDSIRRLGRVHEATMLAFYKLRSHDFMTDLGPGLRLFLKGKIPLLPSRIRGVREIRSIFEKTYKPLKI
ncbi:MAG: 4Fe-4S dicluster domain-containing protein [Deltaproteobacteria bacterium]|nr:4Fe-4S dicluster domain-containing protein [Deltaproteobacteria bacterium]MBW2120505.1 4Fe-4S dicluster domain-containing protein [Deltaproteobacteria bacterium]